MKIILTVIAMAVAAVTAWCMKPQSAAANDPVYDQAAAWCEARLSALPPNHKSRLLFEHTLKNIRDRNVFWGGHAESGIDYNLVVILARDFERTGGRFPVPID